MTDYGNVPEEDVEAIRYCSRLALKVASSLPEVAPPEWGATAYELVLDGLLNDWVENGTTEPNEADMDDLTNLVRVASDVALIQESVLRDITFRVTLKNAMLDWVKNWNEGDDYDEEE
jgi:hypothetical protein